MRNRLSPTLWRVVAAAGVITMAATLVPDARGDSVVQFMTAKSLPDATVAVIDPESGTSSGTSGSDVNLAVGDIILFKFSVASAPASAVRGIQAYLTEYVPPGTEVVGVRMTDANGNTIEPRRAGLALDGCSGGGNCNGTGSIAQVYADTGIFWSNDAQVNRTPVNTFLTLRNGILMSPEPTAIDPEIVQLLNDTSGTYNAHNDWDWVQVLGFGTPTSSIVNGDGNTPFSYGSPVAGPMTYYQLQASRNGSGVVGANGVVGPWRRIKYPGSQIGTGASNNGSTSNMTRVGVDTSTGDDVTPANPVTARAVRYALGEAQVGEIRYVEVALRVKQVPIDVNFGSGGGNVDCGEVFGSDISSKAANTGGANNPWTTFVPHPQCVFLRLKLDLNADRVLASGNDIINYNVVGKNLSVAAETNARVRVKFVGSDQAFVSATPAPTSTFTCPAPDTNKTCLEWTLGTLQPSDDFNLGVRLKVGGTGGGTNVVVAQYFSNQLVAIDPNGFSSTAMTVVQPVADPRITLTNAVPVTSNFAASPSTTWQINGTLINAGTTDWTADTLTIALPSGWRVRSGTTDGRLVYNGSTLTCIGTGCSTAATQTFAISGAIAPLASRNFSFLVNIPANVATGLYDIDVRTRGSQNVFGSFETDFHKAVTVPVGAVRTAPPVLSCPIGSTATTITGTSEANAAIKALFNLIQRGTGTANGAGAWSVSNYSAFGTLYGGLEVRATATAPGKLESLKSDACFVTAVRACSDGLDNDGDGQTDFPADPGCESPGDNTETDPAAAQCSDGVDNNGSGGTDWPNDPSCNDPNDTTENGSPSCSDGLDNDGDGRTDYPADPDCTSATDGSEVFFRACQDGLDNDGDGVRDFPADPGCHSLFDDDEFDAGSSPLETRPRLLLAVDSSGSMNMNTCADEFTGGDGSTECPGGDVTCVTCGSGVCSNNEPDDSRLYQVTNGLANVVAAFGEVEYALMRFHQRAMPFLCPTSQAGRQAGGWQGGGASPCTGGFAAGDLLVSYATDNEGTILDWMNHDSDYDGVAPSGTDFEIRGTGTTPLAGILTSANTYLSSVRASDLKSACRPYEVILVTDGNETCGGNPSQAAATMLQNGIRTHVIGFATPDQTVISSLNAIAQAGGTTSAVFADDEAALSAAIAQIIQDSVLVEECNGEDDDCDTQIDEDFPDAGDACDNGQLGACFDTGVMVCAGNGQGTVCNAQPGSPTPEQCNGADDDCDGLTDEGLGSSCTCTPVAEICNGRDDDCDGNVDEGQLPGVGDSCGQTIGACEPGTLQCIAGALSCEGDTPPGTETCNSTDDDCDTFVDEVSSACYEFNSGCTPGPNGYTCAGVCQAGQRGCVDGADGPCVGDVGPGTETCNGLDDDCDGSTDEDLGLGASCDNGLDGTCFATGIVVCDGAGGTTCTAPVIPPGTESCNGADDDCDLAIDEQLGAPIGNECGGGGSCSVGVFACVAGEVVCQGSETGTAESCNNIDDDCDMRIDENVPGFGGDCIPAGFEAWGDIGACEPGHRECLGGAPQCVDYHGPTQEIPCNGVDEDCDGNDDQTCPGDQACVENGCRNPCDNTEFPCPFGFMCEAAPEPDGVRYCIPDPCANVHCQSGFACDVDDGQCHDLCEGVVCPTGATCANGLCQDCFALGCPTGQICTLSPTTDFGECVDNPCFGVDCPDGQFCRAGTCVMAGCDPACGDGLVCIDGACVDDPCGGPCDRDQVCDPVDRRCEDNQCLETRCYDAGTACNPFSGECVPDPCIGIECPTGFVCVINPDDTARCDQPAAQPRETITAGGGGCAASGEGAGLWLIGLALGGLVLRRRRAAA